MSETNVKETINNEIKEAEEMNESVKETPVAEKKNAHIEEWNKNLPEITGNEKNVILANVDGRFAINMQLIANGGNMRSHGVILFLSDIETGEACIDDSGSLTVKKEKIINSTGDKAMNILDEFSIPISIDVKKQAYARAQKYLNKTTVATNVGTGMRIGEACREIVKYAKEQAEDEQKRETVKIAERKFFYDEKQQRVGIRVEHFQNVLDELGTGYKKSTFGKNIRIEEARTGKDILICNRNGSGFGFNMTGNQRYYMFNIKNVLG